MLKQIVFIYRDEFVSKLVEKLMQRESIQCYGMSKVEENFAYIIDDLEPELVLVDEKSFQDNAELIEESLAQAKSSFTSVILSKDSKTFGKFDASLPLPINIDTFVDQARSLVVKNS